MWPQTWFDDEFMRISQQMRKRIKAEKERSGAK